MDGKKSFLLYCDIKHTIDKLSNDKAGELFKHILAYVNDENPITNDIVIEIAFEPIKQSLKRDLKKWEGEKKQRSEAGKLGMAKRWTNNNESITPITNDNAVISVITPITNITDSVSVSVSEINISFDIFWHLYDKKVGEKKKLEKKWLNLTDKERQSIIDYLPKYKLAIPDKQFRKNPETFFNNKSWNDEIISNNDNKQSKLNNYAISKIF